MESSLMDVIGQASAVFIPLLAVGAWAWIRLDKKFETIGKKMDTIEKKVDETNLRISKLEGETSVLKSMMQTIIAYLLNQKTGS